MTTANPILTTMPVAGDGQSQEGFIMVDPYPQNKIQVRF